MKRIPLSDGIFDEKDHVDVDPSGPPKHRKQGEAFQGLWIPAKLCNMVEDKELTTQEVFVIVTINRFVCAKGEGCWVSNARLGKLCGVSADRMKRIISTLIRKGIVFRIESDVHARLLDTIFSNTRFGKKRLKRRG